MAAKKLLVTAGVAVLIAAGVVAASLYFDKKINENLATALVSVGSGSTGAKVSIGKSSISPLTGEGEIESFTIPNPSGGGNSIVEFGDVRFTVSPFSLLYGPVKIEDLTVGKFNLDIRVQNGRTNMAVIIGAAAAYAGKGSTEFSKTRLIVEHLEITTGKMNVSISVPGRTFRKSAELPITKMGALGNNEKGLSPAALAKLLIQQIGSRAITMALKTR